MGDENYEYGFAGAAWNKGAESAMGSLWRVNDAGTSVLMHGFYHELSNHNLSLAQIQQKILKAMMEGRIYYEGGENPKIIYQDENQIEWSFPILPVDVAHAGFGSGDQFYIHPYYWSPFQIIGSGH